jgi:hypothetical protein
MVSLSIIYPDMDLHVTGCADLGKSVSRGVPSVEGNFPGGKIVALRTVGLLCEHRVVQETVYGTTLPEAIDALNATLADAFCEIAYTDEAAEAECWTINTVNVKPCVVKLMKEAHLTTDERGRPVYK